MCVCVCVSNQSAQEPVLFSMSIAENIRYGNPMATQDDVIEVIERERE